MALSSSLRVVSLGGVTVRLPQTSETSAVPLLSGVKVLVTVKLRLTRVLAMVHPV
jgi:hypothetical protein